MFCLVPGNEAGNVPVQSNRDRGRRPGSSGTTMDMAAVFKVGVRGVCMVTAVGYAETGLQLWEWEWMLMLSEIFSSTQ